MNPFDVARGSLTKLIICNYLEIEAVRCVYAKTGRKLLRSCLRGFSLRTVIYERIKYPGELSTFPNDHPNRLSVGVHRFVRSSFFSSR